MPLDQVWAAFDFPRHPLAREDGERVRGAFYCPPERWLRAHSAAELRDVIDAAHQASRDGAWVLGGLRYEAAGALDAALVGQESGLALAEFAVFTSAPEAWPEALPAGRLSTAWVDVQTDAAECEQVERIREWIRCGDCYQVNLTTRLQAHLPTGVSLAELFLALHRVQPGGFSLFLRGLDNGLGVASVSPELFFDWRPVPDAERSWLLAAQPMKGTTPRGHDKAADEAAQAYLRTSEKERAENLMIVDLLRNDMSRVATLGSVRVPRLFELLALPTVWQMTSTITAVSRPKLRLSDVFAALFPCGSVTGAPKVRAMQIIKALEPAPRGWYCGALGLMQPGGVVSFNVPIRTVEASGHGLTAGVGSAITLDSDAAAEVAEWRAKSRFLLRAQAPIAALETLRLQDGACVRLAGHLARLQRTAQYFGLKLNLNEVRERLGELSSSKRQGAWRLRLTVESDGRIGSECSPLADTPQPVMLALADTAIDTEGAEAEFIRHKTTRRELYEAFFKAKPPQAFDALLWNRAQELTECTFGNIALRIDGQWLTPRLQAGLLPGVYREELLQLGRVREARLLKTDLERAEEIVFFNSLRGWCQASLLPGSGGALSST
ncbi:chorismate-binding protein [Roseateles oligotrophus]|uniref:Chorismate-binding protein n=1 Tax=Roseateles oligotrophus TaxID=1769250 RepID=A0ABT2YGR2_9BURK|nr:chorismate-binding protein [Roseateles oligotrophus]MCV2369234.1 chorismate-binding protein [Roseateles oligotrophus]